MSLTAVREAAHRQAVAALVSAEKQAQGALEYLPDVDEDGYSGLLVDLAGLDLSGEALAIKDVTAQIRHPDLFSQGSDGPKEGHGDSESFVGVLEDLHVVESCLRYRTSNLEDHGGAQGVTPPREHEGGADNEHSPDEAEEPEQLYIWASSILVPPPSVLARSEEYDIGDDDDEDEDEDESDIGQTQERGKAKSKAQERDRKTIILFHRRSTLAIKVLAHLHKLFPLPGLCHHHQQSHINIDETLVAALTSLAIYTDDRKPWTSKAISHAASALLDDMTSGLPHTSLSTVLECILRQRIKPLFAKVKNWNITAQGRKAMGVGTVRAAYDDNGGSAFGEQAAKPWKFDKRYIMTVFRWVVMKMNAKTVETKWPLIIPPLLTIMDDHAPAIKAQGGEILALLLQSTSPALLQRTGLAEIMEGALMPCLSYLPTLTPPGQSVRLLSEAYPALVALSRVRYPDEEGRWKERMGFLDAVLRKGVLAGYAHCPESVRVVEVLMKQLAVLVAEMGVWAVKHLKYICPLLSDILAAPLGTAYAPLLQAAAGAQEAVILNCWPRLEPHRAEILRGIAFGLRNIAEEARPTEELRMVESSLFANCRLLGAVVRGGGGGGGEIHFVHELQRFVAIDARLAGLLDGVAEGVVRT